MTNSGTDLQAADDSDTPEPVTSFGRRAQVRCQARGLKTSVLIHELRGSACRRSAFLGLYAGLGTAAAASAVIGACYLLRCAAPGVPL